MSDKVVELFPIDRKRIEGVSRELRLQQIETELHNNAVECQRILHDKNEAEATLKRVSENGATLVELHRALIAERSFLNGAPADYEMGN